MHGFRGQLQTLEGSHVVTFTHQGRYHHRLRQLDSGMEQSTSVRPIKGTQRSSLTIVSCQFSRCVGQMVPVRSTASGPLTPQCYGPVVLRRKSVSAVGVHTRSHDDGLWACHHQRQLAKAEQAWRVGTISCKYCLPCADASIFLF